MAAAIPFISLGLAAAGTMMSANAQRENADAIRKQAERRQAEANFEAAQLDRDAIQAGAVAHRQAEDETLKARLVNSTALARAAASGAGASDPTVMGIIAKTGGTGSYRAGVALYEGEEQARVDRVRAAALRFSGDVGIADAVTASRIANQGATSTLLTGGAKTASMFSKYWAGPSPDRTSGGGTDGNYNPGSLEGGNSTPTNQLPTGLDSSGGPAYG